MGKTYLGSECGECGIAMEKDKFGNEYCCVTACTGNIFMVSIFEKDTQDNLPYGIVYHYKNNVNRTGREWFETEQLRNEKLLEDEEKYVYEIK